MNTSWPPATRPRDRQLKVRLTEEEFVDLQRRAAIRGLTISELVRDALSSRSAKRKGGRS